MRFLDLFSGIGGFALGLEAAGHHTAAFCEVSPACRHLLNHHWPNVPCYDDIITLTAERLSADGITVDALCGGFPCQDLSYAGKGAGIDGARSGLWSHYARLVCELRPRVVVVENVPALLSRGLGRVLGDLAALGYDAWWDCIPALTVGAPHRRDRIWIIAYARGEQHEGAGDALRRATAARLSGATVAEASCKLGHGRGFGAKSSGGGESAECSSDVAVAQGKRRGQGSAIPGGGGSRGGAQQRPRPGGAVWWQSEPDVGRVAHGIPARVDRLHGLGNAIVPQIAEILGWAIRETFEKGGLP